MTRMLRAGSSCAQQNVASGTNLSCDPGARSPFDSLQILAVGDELGNGAAQLTDAGGAVVPPVFKKFASESRVFQLRDPR